MMMLLMLLCAVCPFVFLKCSTLNYVPLFLPFFFFFFFFLFPSSILPSSFSPRVLLLPDFASVVDCNEHQVLTPHSYLTNPFFFSFHDSSLLSFRIHHLLRHFSFEP